MAKKIYALALKETLATIKQGESMTFTVAGEGRETTYGAISTSRGELPGKYSMQSIDNGLRVVVTHL